MRKALIFGLTLAAALSLAACGKPHPSPEPDPAAVSSPADASAPTPPSDPTPPSGPAPPADAGPAPRELPGDEPSDYPQAANDESAASAPAEREVNSEDGKTEPPQADPRQPLPDAGEEDSSARQPGPTEEEPRQPDPEPDSAGSPDSEAGGFAASEELTALIRAYLASQPEESQQSGAEYDPTDIYGVLAAYREYIDDIQAENPDELREAAEKIFPDAAKYDINWDAVWQAMEAGLFG